MDPQSSFQHHQSPFLSDLDALPHGHPNDTSQSSGFSSFTDFNSSTAIDDALSVVANPSVPTTPYSPSFAAQPGSYHNSPLGSDISYIPGNEFPQHSPNPNTFASGPAGEQFGDFGISVLPPDYTGDDYDPSAYDPPDNHTLLFGSEFMDSLNEQTAVRKNNQNQSSSPSLSTSSLGSNNPGVSVSVTPALDNPMSAYQSGSPYDHGSPASSNGDNDYRRHSQQQQADVPRSRASSISSQPNDFQGSATYGMESVHIDSSPNPNQDRPPSWASKDQGQGLQSPPPHIYIPAQTPEITHTSPLPSPKPSNHTLSADNSSILPPGGIGMGIHIVPATPISAGVAQAGSFQNIGMMSQDRQSQAWQSQPNHHQVYSSQSRDISPHPSRLPHAPPSQYTFPSNAVLTPPPTGGSNTLSLSGNNGSAANSYTALHMSRDHSPERSNGDPNGNNDFLIPISNPRTRSKSETAVRPQTWQMDITGYDSQGQPQDQGSAIQAANSQFGHQQQPMQLPRLDAPHFPASFGPPISGSSGFDGGNISDAASPNMGNNFLSPDYLFGATDLRRSRSEIQGHRRNALSADMKPIFADRSSGIAGANSFNQSEDFLRRSGPFLSPDQTGLSGLGLGGGSGMMGHRRSVSHGGSGHGHSRSLSRERVSLSTSPYPSPHASPRTNGNEPLPDVYSFPPTSSGYGLGGAPEVHVMSHDEQGRPTVQSQEPIQVVRQNVTTHATADASQRRRRTEANFVCPVPGCGSTFTRHFNLKGHLRSHNEERPFKCKWPGCDKGFARQHDCKRHEQLHSNIRPYTCQGCQRTFARMDALNRHLRSDAGTECQTRQPILTTETSSSAGMGSRGDSGGVSGTLTLKAETDSSWQSSGTTGVMV